MVTETKPIITVEKLRGYLPNPLRQSGKEYRTWIEDSHSRTHIAINPEKGVYYDFHYNQGGSIVSLLRQLGVPIGRELAEGSQRQYKRELAQLARFKNEGRYRGCNRNTAILVNHATYVMSKLQRVMCLRWDCAYCAAFLRRVITEHLADYHAGAIYLIPIGYQGVGQALNRVKQKARRVGLKFEWWLFLANDVQILFVDSCSSHEVIDWLENEPFFELEKLNPTYAERQCWMAKGLELMNEPAHWQHKFRHSRGIPSLKTDVDNVSNHTESIEHCQQENQDTELSDDGEAAIFGTQPGEQPRSDWEWRLSPMPLEAVLGALDHPSRIYEADWRSPDIVKLVLLDEHR